MKENIDLVTDFLADYAVELISYGSHTARVRRCLLRMANSYGYSVSTSFFLDHINITVYDPAIYLIKRSYIKSVPQSHVNFRGISELSALSWEVYEDKISIKEARKYFSLIKKPKVRSHLVLTLILSVALASFAKLFGGDFASLVAVFIGTFVGTNLRDFLLKKGFDIRAVFIFVSFLSSYIAYLGFYFGFSETPLAALSASTLYLFWGVPLLNSVYDILNNEILIGLAKLIRVCIMTLCVSLGIYFTLLLSKIGEMFL